jgi:hypothetical protein
MNSALTYSAQEKYSQEEVDALFAAHIASEFGEDRVHELRQQYQREHVVPLRKFCPPALFDALRDEAFFIIERHGVARDFVFEITDNTPRHLTTVGQPIIKEHGPLIHRMYFSPVLKDFMSRIVGEDLFTCPYAGEHYVISRLQKAGDTHGWHWDDYTYGFVMILEAPDYRDGGFVQGVPNTAWDKKNPDVHKALLESRVYSYAFSAGDAYLIKTDTTMHRVYPIRGKGRRTIINTTWANAQDLVTPRTHETNDVLFGGAAPDPVSGRA